MHILIFFTMLMPSISDDLNSIGKYSYLIYGKKNNISLRIGTGFFVKSKEALLLITSRHLIGSYDSFGKKEIEIPETLFINVLDKATSKNIALPISNKTISDSISPALNFEIPDFIILVVPNPEKYTVNSIEKYLPTREISDLEIESVFGYGFFDKSPINSMIDLLNLEPKPYSGYTKGEYNNKIYHKKYDKLDSVNYYIYPYRFQDLQGASGSPVFQRLKTGEIIFAGVYTSSNSSENIYMFVRPKLIVDKIKEHSN